MKKKYGITHEYVKCKDRAFARITTTKEDSHWKGQEIWRSRTLYESGQYDAPVSAYKCMDDFIKSFYKPTEDQNELDKIQKLSTRNWKSCYSLWEKFIWNNKNNKSRLCTEVFNRR